MSNLFNSVKVQKPKSNNFDLSYSHKFTGRLGELIPSHIQECVPGDVFSHSQQSLVRMAPTLAPIMAQFDVYTHYFFVPNRLAWDGWEQFITGGADPENIPAFPYTTLEDLDATQRNKLVDYFGIPRSVYEQNEHINAIPFWAYHFIFHEYYRDQNLDVSAEADGKFRKLKNGLNVAGEDIPDFQLKYRAWTHDYFTSALPFAQKGEAVNIPLSISDFDIPVKYNDNGTGIMLGSWIDPITNDPDPYAATLVQGVDGVTRNGNSGNIINYNPGDTLRAVGSSASSLEGTINDLRTAYRLQEWLELNARAGSRYTENLLAHFGVRSSDKRLQRPEYLGGNKQKVVISEVLQTSETTGVDDTPQGNMSGHLVSIGGDFSYKFFVEEHGFIIGITSVMPKAEYFQGLNKLWSKFDRMEYYWPTFASLGEQAILNKELYFDMNDGKNNETFGYTPRYSEYKYNSNRVSGDFTSLLDFWHAGRKFGNRPLLNTDFIYLEDEFINRIFPVNVSSLEVDYIYFHVYNSIKARRLMPYYSTPR